jgi:hypothetical protein
MGHRIPTMDSPQPRVRYYCNLSSEIVPHSEEAAQDIALISECATIASGRKM